ARRSGAGGTRTPADRLKRPTCCRYTTTPRRTPHLRGRPSSGTPTDAVVRGDVRVTPKDRGSPRFDRYSTPPRTFCSYGSAEPRPSGSLWRVIGGQRGAISRFSSTN